MLRAFPIEQVDQEQLGRLANDHQQITNANLVRFDEPKIGERSVLLLRDWVEQAELGQAITNADEDAIYKALVAFTKTLEPLHDRGVAHGSIKPSRLRLDYRNDGVDSLRIVDLGLDSVVPTRLSPYRAPELRADPRATTQSDLFALGVSFLELIAGPRAVRQVGKRPLNELAPDANRNLLRLVESLVHPNPRKRLRDALALDDSLGDLNWALADRELSTDLLLTTDAVGFEAPLRTLRDMLRAPLHTPIHIVGQTGIGKSRFLYELETDRALNKQWNVVRVALKRDADGDAQVRDACIELMPTAANLQTDALIDTLERVTLEQQNPLLLLVDDVEDGPTLRALETAMQLLPQGRLAVVVAPLGIVESQLSIKIEALTEASLEQLCLPLITESVDPDNTVAQLLEDSAGVPRWVQATLGEWIASNRLRRVHGRVFLEEARSYGGAREKRDTFASLLETLDQEDRLLVGILALHTTPAPTSRLQRVCPTPTQRLAAPLLNTFVSQQAEGWTLQSDALAVRARTWLESQPALAKRIQSNMQADDPALFRGRAALLAGHVEQGVPLLAEGARQLARTGHRWRATQVYDELRPYLASTEVPAELDAIGVALEAGDRQRTHRQIRPSLRPRRRDSRQAP